MNKTELGSKTAKGRFANEKAICRKAIKMSPFQGLIGLFNSCRHNIIPSGLNATYWRQNPTPAG